MLTLNKCIKPQIIQSITTALLVTYDRKKYIPVYIQICRKTICSVFFNIIENVIL